MSTAELQRQYDRRDLRAIWRVEARDTYVVPGDEERQIAWAAGVPLPTRPSKTSWLEKVRAMVDSGITVGRVHIIDQLTPYLDYEIRGAYPENTAAGEQVWIAHRDAAGEVVGFPGEPVHPLVDLHRDFVLFDGNSSADAVVWFDYTDAGELLEHRLDTTLATIRQCRKELALALALAVPLDQYLTRAA